MTTDLRRSLVDDLEEIEAAVTAFKAGRQSAYQTVAIQLRNLLADTSRAGPLLERILTGAKFERLRPRSRPAGSDPDRRRMTWTVDCRGVMHMSTGPPYLTVTLDVVEDDLVPVDEWLNDWIAQPDMIIQDLIYQVASKEVAHTDAEVGEFEIGTQDGACATVAYSLVDRDDPSVVVVRIDVGDPSTFVWEDDQWKGPDCG